VAAAVVVMPILENHVLVRYDRRRRKVVFEYVHTGARLAGNTALLTELRSADIRKDKRVIKLIGEVLLIVVGAGHLLPPKKPAKKKPARTRRATMKRR
jgi:hypothetical protein